MEISQIALNNGLTFLAVATGIIVLVVGGFLVKLLFDLSKLTKNLNETTQIVNTELKPTLENINQTLNSINEIVTSTNNGVGDVKNAIGKVVDKTKLISGSLIGGLLNGFATVYKLFKK